ncbi:hypothetical protein TNCV_1518861 [Trichonephila clavipes]|nr:hypothetical protein TNCV_1518861 [Trichonephila clavipes]
MTRSHPASLKSTHHVIPEFLQAILRKMVMNGMFREHQSYSAERISDVPGIFQNIKRFIHGHFQICQTTSGRNCEHLL